MLTYKNMVSFEIYRIQVKLEALKGLEYAADPEQKLKELAAARIQAQMLVNELKALKELEKTL